MSKIAVLGVYFGEFPNNMSLWLKSCGYNTAIDFLLFTDQRIQNKPDNVKVIKMSLKEFSSLASRNLGMNNLCLDKPYKCCDFRPAYGVIFYDYLKGYDFWGHCDLDLVFGSIMTVLGKEVWKKNDKILTQGHLAFYRNVDKVNNRYKESGSKVGSYLDIFTTSKSYAFDETMGIMKIYEQNGYPFYKERVFADISVIYNRFRLALKDKNYKHQVFYWENGHACRSYLDPKSKTIETDEFAYIHFKKRKYLKNRIEDPNKCNSFYITNKGFIEKRPGTPTLDDIKKYNPYKGFLYEKAELINYSLKNHIRAIGGRIKKVILRKI